MEKIGNSNGNDSGEKGPIDFSSLEGYKPTKEELVDSVREQHDYRAEDEQRAIDWNNRVAMNAREGGKNDAAFDFLDRAIEARNIQNSERAKADLRGQKVAEAYDAWESGELTGEKFDCFIEDASVIFGLCDFDTAKAVIESENYQTLLDNEVLLGDLFDAGMLFDKQYYDDGYELNDGGLGRFRGYSENINRYELGEYNGRIVSGQIQSAVDIIAEDYCSDDDKMQSLREIIAAKKGGDAELTEEQKDFLRAQNDLVAERILTDGKDFSEERVANIMNGIDIYLDDYVGYKEHGLDSREKIMQAVAFAKHSLDDFYAAGKGEMVDGVRQRIEGLCEEHFEEIFDVTPGTDMNVITELPGLLLNYTGSFKLVDRLIELRENDTEDDMDEEWGAWYYWDGLADGDKVLAKVHERDELYGDAFVRENVGKFKQLGASDEALINIFSHGERLSSYEFYGRPGLHGEKYSVTSGGNALLEGGVERNVVLQHIFNWSPSEDWGPLHGVFDEIPMGMLEDAGFTPTEAAETFTPDKLVGDLDGVLARGADAKDVMKYMMSYHEHFAQDIHFDEDGTMHDDKMWHDGRQDMMVFDKNHEEYRLIKKEGMQKTGKECVMEGMEIFAHYGVQARDIIAQCGYNEVGPQSKFLKKMLQCKKFDTKEVMVAAYKRYNEREKALAEVYKGWDETPVEEYFADLAKSLAE